LILAPALAAFILVFAKIYFPILLISSSLSVITGLLVAARQDSMALQFLNLGKSLIQSFTWLEPKEIRLNEKNARLKYIGTSMVFGLAAAFAVTSSVSFLIGGIIGSTISTVIDFIAEPLAKAIGIEYEADPQNENASVDFISAPFTYLLRKFLDLDKTQEQQLNPEPINNDLGAAINDNMTEASRGTHSTESTFLGFTPARIVRGWRLAHRQSSNLGMASGTNNQISTTNVNDNASTKSTDSVATFVI
jgi:hypothetical protein